jgi:hypothetical protein
MVNGVIAAKFLDLEPDLNFHWSKAQVSRITGNSTEHTHLTPSWGLIK